MDTSYNQRAYTRINVDFAVTVELRDGSVFTGTMVDISAGGLRIDHPSRPAAGTKVICSFVGAAQTLIQVRGVVCSNEGTRFGVRITGYDRVSFAHLRSLLLNLADDPHAVEDEILLHLDKLPEPD